VITVGSISGGSAPNIIAEKAMLRGTISTTHPNIRDNVLDAIRRMVNATGELFGAEASITFEDCYPPVINDERAAETARRAAELVVGQDRVLTQAHPSLGGEDFSFYLEKIPGCFVRFGACKQGHEYIPAHSSRFDFDEDVMQTGAAFLACVALKALNGS
jgi:hippurate hydrolase